jgi:hypothetical protein
VQGDSTQQTKETPNLPPTPYKGTVLFQDMEIGDTLDNLSCIVDFLAETHREEYGLTLLLGIVKDTLSATSDRLKVEGRR